jgi:hypothetical protein
MTRKHQRIFYLINLSYWFIAVLGLTLIGLHILGAL